MLLCILLDFFQMLVVTVFSQPADNVAIGPINLKSVRMLVVDVILIKVCNSGIYQASKVTHVNGHLVDMDAFLNAKFWNKNIECGIQNTDNLRLTNDGSITSS